MAQSTIPSKSASANLWHTLTPERAIALLESSPEGLSPSEAEHRQQVYGPNELQEGATRSPWEILWDQFKNIMLLMLIAVALVSLVLDLREGGFPKDAIAIFAIVLLNGILGYLQESKAEKALAALKNMTSPRVRTIRQGQEQEIDAKALVPGDVVLLEAGVQVPADGRLLSAANLQVREAALTGEAEAVIKQPELLLEDESALGDRLNLVYQGTEVLQGRGTVLVTQTGMTTELGRIATLIQSVETEPTPLQQRMAQLGNVLVTGSLVLVALVVVAGLLRTGDLSLFDELLEVSLSMAVAVVPEGLPAVITVTLALGTQRMVKRHALIRKLPAVETLGSVTTICSDKTGTLTQNKMVVQQVKTVEHQYEVTGEGYAPVGNLLENGSAIAPQSDSSLQALLMACALCNDATLNQSGSIWTLLGDPTEGALLAVAGKGGFDQEKLGQQSDRIGEVPFTSERKRMSVVVQAHADATWPLAPQVMFTKGSAELVLERCSTSQGEGQLVPLTEAQRQAILAHNDAMASSGLRVLGFAMKPTNVVANPNANLEPEEQNLIWLGLVGMLDAPRPEVRAAVVDCRRAGIRPVMITGDHPLTAKAIAETLGIAKPGDTILTGRELSHLSPEELERTVPDVSVYARVAPEHKLRIVQALQKQGEFVAMTGDGVNDAPALKQADIGIAMGITGTDVSKEASDMVLLDDNFATIVAATEEGRVVYDNIRRFIKYILGSNIGEVLTIAAAPIMGLGGVPLSPLQILWMNLVTDGVPALALAMEPAEPDVMERPPHNPRESIFARGLGSYMVRVGIVLAVLTIGLMGWAYRYTTAPGYPGHPDTWKTMVFTTLCLAQMGHALAARSDTRLTAQLNPLSNPYIWGAVLLTTGLQVLLLYVPVLAQFFGLHPLAASELAICFGFSALMFAWLEIEKLVIQLSLRRKQPSLPNGSKRVL
ncbi:MULTISPECIES: cation-translocating P-type ATPase [Cyanophyceae]|uniref:Cation-translocating P-type ATPase n=1 Tax=Leptolyngbya subtilissima DQ-A4 TaxID=2933933 RepID=A0ABV0JZQ0_9CYAN|nr:cation-translocating P-type ATPase [Nodosilinea sp. FACHB-141]MBD2112629.1 cation-translocating P-type ATPase [Nodosilinea sp. FACHB-141]